MSFCDALTVMLQLCFSIDKFRFLSELVLNGCLPPEYKIEQHLWIQKGNIYIVEKT